MTITATLNPPIAHRLPARTGRWQKFLGWLSAPTPDAAPSPGAFARAVAADPGDPLLFAACLEAENLLQEESRSSSG